MTDNPERQHSSTTTSSVKLAKHILSMRLFRGGRTVLAETRAHDYMPAPAGGMSASEGLRRDLPTAGDNTTLFVFFVHLQI